MGSTQSRAEFNTDPGRRSKGAKLPPSQHNKLIIFGENTANQIAPLLSSLTDSPVGSLHLHLKVDYDPTQSGDLVLGLSRRKLNPNTTIIENNRSLYVWYITKGKIEYEGRVQQLHHHFPIVEKGGEISVEFSVATGKVMLTVKNPGSKEPFRKEMKLTNLPPKMLLVPFVGAVNTGNSKPSLLICESSITSHNNNSLTDFTYKIFFNTTYGIINVSSSLKSVSRKSTQQGNGCALLPVKMSSGVHRWIFTVRCDFGASMCLGLARYPFRLSEEYAKDHVKHIYRHPGLLLYRTYRGILYKDGKQQDSYLESLGWQNNTAVNLEFVFDCNKGTLEILKNGVRLGVAFDNLSGIFQPVVCFYASYEKEVEFKQYMSTETSLDIIQSPPSSLVSDDDLKSDDLKANDLKTEQEINAESICFDKTLLHGAVNISPDRKSLFRQKSEAGNCYCFLNVKCFRLGTYRISFVIEFDQGASMCLGVTQANDPSEVKLSKIGNVYMSKSLYLYRSFQGMLYTMGKEESTRLEEFWMSGTLVEMEIDVASNESCVRFKVNGMDQGVAFSGLQAPLRPLVAYYAGMEKRVTIIHYEFVAVETATALTTTTTTTPPTTSRPPRILLQGGSDSVLNDVSSTLTHASKCTLPALCSPSDAASYHPSCMHCEAPNDIICLPCRHSTVCSKHLSLGPNAPVRRCMICDQKIIQIWNILVPSSSSHK